MSGLNGEIEGKIILFRFSRRLSKALWHSCRYGVKKILAVERKSLRSYEEAKNSEAMQFSV